MSEHHAIDGVRRSTLGQDVVEESPVALVPVVLNLADVYAFSAALGLDPLDVERDQPELEALKVLALGRTLSRVPALVDVLEDAKLGEEHAELGVDGVDAVRAEVDPFRGLGHRLVANEAPEDALELVLADLGSVIKPVRGLRHSRPARGRHGPIPPCCQ